MEKDSTSVTMNALYNQFFIAHMLSICHITFNAWTAEYIITGQIRCNGLTGSNLLILPSF